MSPITAAAIFNDPAAPRSFKLFLLAARPSKWGTCKGRVRQMDGVQRRPILRKPSARKVRLNFVLVEESVQAGPRVPHHFQGVGPVVSSGLT